MTSLVHTLHAPLVTLLLAASAGALSVIDFEDVGANLPLDGNFYYDGIDAAGGFTSGGVHFSNSNTSGFWSGFAYSQETDSTTAGFGNQWSAFTGVGSGGSATYGLGFEFSTPTISFATTSEVVGVDVTNTTYTALSMLDGDAFARQFGTSPNPADPPGSHPDWLLLTIRGFDAVGLETSMVDFYLADYRFADDSLDYVVDTWEFVDLSALGGVRSITFELSGSDSGEFGLNTPAYFALDDLVAPEPGSGALVAFGLVALARMRTTR